LRNHRPAVAALEICPGCGISLPRGDGPGHPYIGATPSCWQRYGELLAREFGDPGYFRVHHTTVDTVRGRLTVFDALATESADAHREAVNAWTLDVWQAWSAASSR
jgi:hypothetical protein